MDFLEKIKIVTIILAVIDFMVLLYLIIFVEGKYPEKTVLTATLIVFLTFVYDRDMFLGKGNDSIEIKTPENKVDKSKIDLLRNKSD